MSSENSKHKHAHDHKHDHIHAVGESCGASGHHHVHHHAITQEPDRIFKIGIFVNLGFVGVEFFYGYKIDSLALISDAFHNLTDVFALILGWLGYYLTKAKQNPKYSLYSAFFNSMTLVVGAIWVIYEAFERFNQPEIPAPTVMILVAAVGFFVNFFSARLFHKDLHGDLNMKSAYWHLMGDAAVSLGVVATGIILYFYSLPWLDPVVSLIISLVILIPAIKLVYESSQQLKNSKK